MLTRKASPPHLSTAGFTLIEALVVVIMIAVLMSIAAPGWLAFANRQRVNSVRDAALQVLRTTQTQAQQRRETHVITVDASADIPTLRTGTENSDGFANVLGSDQIQPGSIQLQAFLLDENNSWISTNTIAFNYQGAVAGDSIFKLEVRPTSGGEVRCVVVTTLLGSMQTFNGNACDNTNFSG